MANECTPEGYTITPPVYVDPTALPAVTEDDNGKVLAVVDGKWAVVDISSL